MRYLLVSLFCVTIFATISLGWLFDNVYAHYQNENHQSGALPSSSTEIIKSIGLDLAITINNTSNIGAFLSHQSNTELYHLSLHAITDVELPEALKQQLIQGEIIVLETKNTQLFHYYLNNKNQTLLLESPRLSHSNQYSDEQYILTVSFYLLLVLLFLAWAYPLLKQLSSLRNAAKSFGNGKLDVQLASKPTSYIRDIEVEFNNMARRINNLIADVKLLSTAVSHLSLIHI